MVTTPSRRSRSGTPSSGAHLLGWLGNDAQAASVLATAQLHIKMCAAVSSALPTPMRGAFDVVKIENNVLTLTVSSAAFAAKFRQLAPRVTSHLTGLGWNLTEIKLRVQGGLRLPEAPHPKKEARALDEQDLRAFEELGAQLRPGPLADAVTKLLSHHRATASQVKPASTPGETPAALQPAKRN